MLGFHINPQPLAIGFSETFSSNPKVGFKLIKENSSGEIDCLMIKKFKGPLQNVNTGSRFL